MKTPPPPMWGEVLEEDLYDDSEPFYDHELHRREFAARKQHLEEVERKHPARASSTDGAAPKLKRKVIYVYESQDKPPAQRKVSDRPVGSSEISRLAQAG